MPIDKQKAAAFLQSDQFKSYSPEVQQQIIARLKEQASTPEQLPEMKAYAPSWSDKLQSFKEDLQGGGARTAMGRILGILQGRGDKGYSGLEAGVSPETAYFMGSPEMGVTKMIRAGALNLEGKPVEAAKEGLSGLAQASTIPSMVMGGPGAMAAMESIPSAKWAGKMLESVSADAGNVPVQLSNTLPELNKFMQLVKAGGQQPKVISDLLDRIGNLKTAINKGSLTYDEARRFYSNLSRLSDAEMSTLNPLMRRQMSILAQKFSQDVANAAAQVDRAGDYWAAMKDYARAAKLKEAGKLMLKKFAIPAVGGATGAAIGYKLYKGLVPSGASGGSQEQ